jgi:hypothetical protein
MRCNLVYTLVAVPPNPKKIEALRSCGALNRNPEKVRHPLFTENDFFDPHDLIQLKYETIRAVEIDDRPIAQASVEFGLSRPTIYEAQENFRHEGLGGSSAQQAWSEKGTQTHTGSLPLSGRACCFRARS